MVLAIVGALALGLLASVGAAGGGKGKGHSRSLQVKLTGYEETPSTLSTPARGKLKLKIRNSSTPSIEYKLSYSGFLTTVTQAHIHFGARALSGGISAWLCDSATNPAPVPPAGVPDTTPTCGQTPAGTKVTLTGSIPVSGVVGPAGQGIAAGEFAELIAAIKAGVTYGNVHTSAFPGGEIRGQLDRKNDD